MGKVIAVCTSDRRGIQKHDVNSGYFEVNWVLTAMRTRAAGTVR